MSGRWQEAAARMALLREDCDVKLLDGVCVSLVDRPAHRARLCDWLLDLSHALLAADAADSDSDAPTAHVESWVTTERAHLHGWHNRSFGSSTSFSCRDHEPRAGNGDAAAARVVRGMRRFAPAVVAGLGHASRQDVCFRYFIDKVCKVQVSAAKRP